MILPYQYWYFKSALSNEVCDQILELGLNKLHDTIDKHGINSTMATTGDFKQKDSPVRKNSHTQQAMDNSTASELTSQGINIEDVYIRDSNVVFLSDRWLGELIWPYIHQANKSAGWNFEWDFTEDLQFTKYSVGQFYGWHADSAVYPYGEFRPDEHEHLLDSAGKELLDIDGHPLPKDSHLTTNPNMIGKIRKLSVTVSLNDPAMYDGGNLKFDYGPHAPGERYYECEEIRPRGSIIVFPSHLYHQVTPVTRGTRYSLVAWNLGKPFV